MKTTRPRKRSKEKARVSARKSRLWLCFRITPEEQDAIIEFQKNHPVYKLLLGKKLGTDHCHRTGLIRGMLEWRINRAYGLIEKVAPNNLSEVLRALAEFNDNPPAVLALGSRRFGLVGKAQRKKRMVYGSQELFDKFYPSVEKVNVTTTK